MAAIDEKKWLDAWNSQKAGPIIEISDPEIEVHAVTLGVGARQYRGHEGVRQWMRDIAERFNAYSRAEAIDRLADDVVMVRGTLFMRDEFGGADQEQLFAMIIHLRDDKALWIGTFFSASDAKAAWAAGVTGPDPG